MKDLSIIIVNYRSWGKLTHCLNSLACISGSQFSFEVIIVDNASQDGKLNEFRQNYQPFRFVANTGNYGFASGCNLGAKNAIGRYLLFLNPDTIVSENALLAMLEQAKVSSLNSIISCRQIRENGKEDKPHGIFPSPLMLTGWSRAIAKILHLKPAILKDEHFIFPDWVSGSVVMISKSGFNSVGGWNEKFWMYFEDVDFCKRSREVGGEIFLLTNVSIVHNHGGSSRSSVEVTSLTKAEVNISRHEYISIHEHGAKEVVMQSLLVMNNLIFGLVPAILGLLLFFNRRMLSFPFIYINMLNYYFRALVNNTWVSPRSVLYPEINKFIKPTDKNLIPAGGDVSKRAS